MKIRQVRQTTKKKEFARLYVSLPKDSFKVNDYVIVKKVVDVPEIQDVEIVAPKEPKPVEVKPEIKILEDSSED